MQTMEIIDGRHVLQKYDEGYANLVAVRSPRNNPFLVTAYHVVKTSFDIRDPRFQQVDLGENHLFKHSVLDIAWIFIQYWASTMYDMEVQLPFVKQVMWIVGYRGDIPSKFEIPVQVTAVERRGIAVVTLNRQEEFGPGVSGSALLDSKGKIRGVLSRGLGTNFTDSEVLCIPIGAILS